MGQSLVFASHRPPYPPYNGSRIRAERLLVGLAHAFETTFLTFEHHPDSPDGHCSRQELEQLLPGVEVITVPGLGPGKRWAQARTLASRRSWTYGRYAVPAFGAALRRAIRRRRAAIVHFDDLGVGQFGPLDAPLNVFAPHNIEHRIIQGEAQVASGIRRFFAEVESRKLAGEERRLWRTMPLCLAVSEVDAEAMRAGGATQVALCPNGTDPVSQLRPPVRRADEPFRLLFVGSGSYRPYESGLAWFIREALPRVQASLSTTFDVVGRPPRRPVPGPGVTYIGPVASVTPWYERAHAVVVPVFEGSGTRLKLMEALAHGRPAVATRIGAEGLPIQPREHYWQADDPESFAAALMEIEYLAAHGSGELVDTLARARAAIAPLFWPDIVERLIETYRAELDSVTLAPSWRGAITVGRSR